MSNKECASDCMTIVSKDAVIVSPTQAVAGHKGVNPLWTLTGLPVVGGLAGVVFSTGGESTSSFPNSPVSAVPLSDISLLPATVLSLIVLILVKRRMKTL